MAGDAAGDLITSTDPTASAATWTVADEVDHSARIDAVSCASRRLCVAAGSDGTIIHSTQPSAGTSAWKPTGRVLRTGDALTSLSCPSDRLCVGVDRRGEVVYSRDPAGSARAWRSARVLSTPHDWLVSIDCPTTTECLAVDRLGHDVAYSRQPASGGHDWHLTSLHTLGGGAAPSIACASLSLCVIIGTDRQAIGPVIGTATQPTGGRSAWHFGRPPRGLVDLTAVSCPTTTFCAVGGRDSAARIAYSTQPADGAISYRTGLSAPTDSGYPEVAGLSCASASQCVFFAPDDDAGTGTGQVAVTKQPTATSRQSWPTFVVDAYNRLESVACPSPTLCVSGGPQKTAYTSANPAGGAGAWSATALPTGADRVSCGAVDQCVVADADGDLAATATPLLGGWTEAQTSTDLPDGGAIAVLSCSAGPFCLAGAYEVQTDADLEGTSALVSTDPAGGAGDWTYSQGFIEGGINGGGRPAKGTVAALTCQSQRLCVAGDAKGGILTSTTPANVETWRYARADGTASINDLACPSASLCVGVDSQGDVIHSTNPTGSAWSRVTIDAGSSLTAVSCATAGFCVAVDGQGNAFVSTDPTGGASAWRKLGGIDRDLTSIACPTTGLCVAVDARGNEVTVSG